MEEDKCPICLTSLTESEVHKTHCKHSFHKNCFDKIIKKACPVCRADVALPKVINNDNDVVNEIRRTAQIERAEQRRLLQLELDIIKRDYTISDEKLAAILFIAKNSPQFSIADLLGTFKDDGRRVSPVAISPPSGNVSSVASHSRRPVASHSRRPVASSAASSVASSVASSAASGNVSHSRRPVARSVASPVASFQLPLPPPSSDNVGQKRKHNPTRAFQLGQKHSKNNSGGKKTKKKGQRTHRRKKNTSRSLYTIK